jgi:hypothetical protein
MGEILKRPAVSVGAPLRAEGASIHIGNVWLAIGSRLCLEDPFPGAFI